MTRRKKPTNSLTKHHILPTSRHGNNNEENIATIKDKKHRAYHQLFSNKSPDEIIRHLVDHYWNGQWKWVAIAINEKEWEDEDLPR